MRAGNLGSVAYVPATPPSDPKGLAAYLTVEFRNIAGAIQLLAAGHIDTVYAAPTKPREGDIRLADGTEWDPGSGAGVYAYYGSSWNKLG